MFRRICEAFERIAAAAERQSLATEEQYRAAVRYFDQATELSKSSIARNNEEIELMREERKRRNEIDNQRKAWELELKEKGQ